MRNQKIKFIAMLAVLFLLTMTIPAQTTGFNYQGKLSEGGNPASGSYLLQFKLFDAAAGGSQIGSTVSDVAVTAAAGVFTTRLDFGVTPFTGEDRFLEISVKRNASDAYTILSPRQQINSSPYSIRTLSAAQADVALDANKLGGVDASEYVTTASVGNSFIKNATTTQTGANFNIAGNGVVGGTLGVGTIPSNGFKIDINGAAQIRPAGANSGSTIQLGFPVGEPGVSLVEGTSGRADIRFSRVGGLKLVTGVGTGTPNFANGINITTAGIVGIGTDTPRVGLKLEVNGPAAFTPGGSGGEIQFGTPGGETGTSIIGTNRADFRFNGSTLKLLAGLGTGVPPSTNGLAINTAGNVGIGTITPATRLALSGGTPWTSNGWTGSLSMTNASAIGWEANASGQRFGIGQSSGGLYFFRTTSGFGTTGSPANYDVGITDTGNLTQPITANGLVKAMIYVQQDGTILRCYSGITNSTTGNCGFSVTRNGNGQYFANFNFKVDDRFLSLTARNPADPQTRVSASFRFRTNFGLFNEVEILTFITNVETLGDDANFMIIVY
jgi:hypothetical protein